MKKYMKKILLMLLVAFFATANANAQQSRLVVWQKNGQKVYFELGQQPRTTFKGDKIVITTSGMTTEYDRKNILRYTYEGISQEIESMSKDDFGIMQKDDLITIKGAKAYDALRLYDANGILLESKKADGSVPVTFSLAGRAAGVYIINIGNQSFKFMKQ